MPRRRLSIDPVLTRNLRSLEVRNVRFPAGELSIDVDDRGPRLLAVPPGMVIELGRGGADA